MGNILTTQNKTRFVVIMVGMYLFMSQKVLAVALFDHIIQPYVGTQMMYDNNLLRLPKDFTPDLSGNRTTKSSFIKQIKAGVSAKWQISQQQLIADVSIDQNWFSTFNELDYTGHNLLGQWNWRIGKKLQGQLSYSNKLQLGTFQQLNKLVENNLENKENYIANGSYKIFPDWYIKTEFTRSSTRYLATERQSSNLIEQGKEFGFGYLNALQNMFGLLINVTDGKYVNRSYPPQSLSSNSVPFDNAYTRYTYGLEGIWYYSIKTRIRGDIGYTSQEFKHVPSRNFSDIVARGDIFWDVTSKTSVYLELWREIYSAESLNASFVLAQGVRVTPTWTWSETPKIQVELPVSYVQQTPLGSIGVTSDPTEVAQQSNQSIVRLNLNYTPVPNIEMTGFAFYEERRSSPIHSYQDQTVGLTMKVSF
jgi:hypothetical protein